MKMLAWILSIVGGVCGIVGIVAGIVGPDTVIGTKAMTAEWWLIVAAVLLVATVAANQFRKGQTKQQPPS